MRRCCNHGLIDHPHELVSVCFHCGKFYDNQTGAEVPPLNERQEERLLKRRVFTNDES